MASGENEHRPITRGAILKHLLAVLVAGVALYGLAPKLGEVFGDWPLLRDIEPGWFAVMGLAQSASFVCQCVVQRIASGERRLGHSCARTSWATRSASSFPEVPPRRLRCSTRC